MSGKNKQYAIDAVQILRKQPELSSYPRQLWDKVGTVSPNGQIDVVTALWKANLISDCPRLRGKCP